MTDPPSRQGRTDRPDPLVGTIVAGKYRIQSLIASGGMGKIYKAEQQPLGRLVALKLLHSARLEADPAATDAEVLEKRFFREASILARLQHPNIVTVFDYGAIESTEVGENKGRRFYMAMELLQGETLHDRLAGKKSMTPDETVRLARQLARGLREAHALGIVHRDLKPLNLMICTDRDGEEQVKILDFGIVKLVDEHQTGPQQELTSEGLFVGSPMYMAPEQIETGKVDVRSDVYSLGVVLYRCLAGNTPFASGTSMQIMVAHLHQPPTPLREYAPDVPPWLDDLVMRCLHKKPEHRPQSMDEVLRTLAELPSDPITLDALARASAISGSGPIAVHVDEPTLASPLPISTRSGKKDLALVTQTSSTASLRPMPSPPPPKSKRGLFLLIGAVLLVGGIGAFFGIRARDSEAPVTPTTSASAPPTTTQIQTFAMTIDSTPAGAEVYEGEGLVGTTPLHLTLDKAAVSKSPRRFVVKHAGYLPYSIVQGASDAPVRIVAAMVAESTVPTASVAPAVTLQAPVTAPIGLPKPPPPKPTTTSKPTTSDMDIIPKR